MNAFHKCYLNKHLRQRTSVVLDSWQSWCGSLAICANPAVFILFICFEDNIAAYFILPVFRWLNRWHIEHFLLQAICRNGWTDVTSSLVTRSRCKKKYFFSLLHVQQSDNKPSDAHKILRYRLFSNCFLYIFLSIYCKQ